MSSLPLIPHHLYVAAIGTPLESPSRAVEANDAKAIELEVLDLTEPIPESAARSSRSSRSSPSPRDI